MRKDLRERREREGGPRPDPASVFFSDRPFPMMYGYVDTRLVMNSVSIIEVKSVILPWQVHQRRHRGNTSCCGEKILASRATRCDYSLTLLKEDLESWGRREVRAFLL